MKYFSSLAVSFFALSACGSATTPVPTAIVGAPSSNTHGTTLPGSTATHDSASDTVTIASGGAGAPIVLTAVSLAGWNSSAFSAYLDVGAVALHATTPSGSGQVVVFKNSVTPSMATITQRLSQTTLPTQGTANFTGDYVAIYGGLLHSGSSTIQGNAGLQADFSSNTIGGDVTNRVSGGGAATFADITLGNAPIDGNAQFSGTATGGETITGGSSITSVGSYTGQIVGPNGTEVVGSVLLPHTAGTFSLIEIGGFVGGS